MIGKIGVAVSGADSNRVYALVENENGGLFSSDDAGATWTLVNAGRNIRQRAFYYTHVAADPKNKDTVYVLNAGTFDRPTAARRMANVGRQHGDHHDLWIDPDDPQHIVHAQRRRRRRHLQRGQRHSERGRPADYPTGAVLPRGRRPAHVPYHVCGAQQDSSTLCVPSDTNLAAAGEADAVAVEAAEVAGRAPAPTAPAARNPATSRPIRRIRTSSMPAATTDRS